MTEPTEPEISDSVSAIFKNLKNKRTYLKRNVTILQNYLADFDLEKSDSNFQKIKDQFEICERCIEKYRTFFESIYDVDYADRFDEYFIESLINDYAKAKSQSLKLLIVPLPINPLIQQPIQNNELKLPAINLPTFSGRYDEWLSFKESFNSLIDSNNSITPIRKLQYLKSSLKGDALELVKCLEIKDSNYQVVMDLLTERYENRRVIVKNHIRALFDYSSLIKESYTGIRQILDTFSQHLRALESLGRPVKHWDDLIVHLLATKLPLNTRREWEEKAPTKDPATLQEFRDFLSNKCHALEACSVSKEQDLKFSKGKSALSNVATSNKLTCFFCEQNHFLFKCEQFLNLNVNERIEAAKNKGLCLNCLRVGHTVKDCKSSNCNLRHHSLLHLEKNVTSSNLVVNDQSTKQNMILTHVSNISMPSNVLLSTCIVQIRGANDNFVQARILLDSGSQINFIREKMVNELGLRKNETNLTVIGFNNKVSDIKHQIKSEIKSCVNNFRTELSFFVLPKITNNIPFRSIDPSDIQIPHNIQLADPQFHKSGEIDALLGAEIFYKLLCVGQIVTNQPNVVLQKTRLGWVVTGSILDNSKSIGNCNVATVNDLDKTIRQFWEVEQKHNSEIVKTAEELDCELHFARTVKRQEDGRFIVALPWKGDHLLGNTYNLAKRRLLSMERKFEKNASLKNDYCKFMTEYEALGHMKLVTDTIDWNDQGCFLPHHAVFKQESLTTKIRVVFDGSIKTDTGKSLNDLLMSGPVIQDDLFSILLRFRSYTYVVIGDVNKMYRQVLVNSDDTKYQRILWRSDTNDRIDVYQLQTITYGTSPGSFLATRCLFELAKSVEQSNQVVARTVMSDFYIDDLLTGNDCLETLQTTLNGLNKLLASGGFNLMKWTTNDNRVLTDIARNESKNLILNFEPDERIKTLGVHWSPVNDSIIYCTSLDQTCSKVTKRTMLSHIAQIYDPLGLLGPTIVIAKHLMQQLWQIQSSWDESVPLEIHCKWREFVNSLTYLPNLKINRNTIIQNNVQLELHGFADASEICYGACVYVKSVTSDGHILCNLICSKSRIAPLKTLTLARLELCAATLLANLMHKVINSMHRTFSQIRYYSDSTITLSWIRACPSRWKTFVAHRVSEIQSLSDKENWFHVPSGDNPADILSRGATPRQLDSNELWWHGPNWLCDNESYNLTEPECSSDIPEAKVLIVTQNNCDYNFDLIEQFSNYNKLLRITALCKRFIYNLKNKDKRVGLLTARELNEAENSLIHFVQNKHFEQERNALLNNRPLDNKSKLLCLNPFLDKDGLLRVGGRLKNSNLKYNVKHPILLPAKIHFTKLILKNAHFLTLHGGANTTLAHVREKFWPLSAKNTIKGLIRECIPCFKTNPTNLNPIMANLPNARVESARPFIKTGVDYFGPLYLKEGTRRSKRTVKGYGALFVCMTTRAVHLELVSDLTSQAFLAALRRFTARRGGVVDIFSDNATNFIGADNELRKMLYQFGQDEHQKLINDDLAKTGINWHFIPPRAPHFGGLWEAAVKNAKTYICRIVGETKLTFEEMSTLLAQVESVMNSRPLTPISDDPNDLHFLTPGHFLMGDYAKEIPEPDLLSVPCNRLTRWQLVQRLHQHFWQRWHKEYLVELQKRSKWKSSKGPELVPGRLVLIREDNVSPKAWKVGRILQVHPGHDNVVRVATVKTSSDVLKRPTVKLCPLPTCDDGEL